LLPNPGNVAAAAVEKTPGITQLIVFIENYTGNGKEITEQLISIFPSYKIPEKITGVPVFPLSPSGKTDKRALVVNYLNS
jgi:acyl-CoA synthetase (AMP-forming)/AMP-acid ligase II